MSTTNPGEQIICWKYTTPLKAEYLNHMIAGLTNPGLASRPVLNARTVSNKGEVIIGPFSLFIEPGDLKTSYEDADGKNPVTSLVKVCTTESVTVIISKETVAVGFRYLFNASGTPDPLWYGDFVPLGKDEVEDFDGIIIATCQSFTANDSSIYYNASTSGAEISDLLLKEEGHNPECWVSLISPRRMPVTAGGTGYYNQVEVRNHNDAFSGMVSGFSSVNQLSNLRYTFPSNSENDPNGDRASQLPGRYNSLILRQSGFILAGYASDLPMSTSSGVICVMDANLTRGLNPRTAFANNLKLMPVKEKLDLNVSPSASQGSGDLVTSGALYSTKSTLESQINAVAGNISSVASALASQINAVNENLLTRIVTVENKINNKSLHFETVREQQTKLVNDATTFEIRVSRTATLPNTATPISMCYSVNPPCITYGDQTDALFRTDYAQFKFILETFGGQGTKEITVTVDCVFVWLE